MLKKLKSDARRILQIVDGVFLSMWFYSFYFQGRTQGNRRRKRNVVFVHWPLEIFLFLSHAGPTDFPRTWLWHIRVYLSMPPWVRESAMVLRRHRRSPLDGQNRAPGQRKFLTFSNTVSQVHQVGPVLSGRHIILDPHVIRRDPIFMQGEGFRSPVLAPHLL